MLLKFNWRNHDNEEELDNQTQLDYKDKMDTRASCDRITNLWLPSTCWCFALWFFSHHYCCHTSAQDSWFEPHPFILSLYFDLLAPVKFRDCTVLCIFYGYHIVVLIKSVHRQTDINTWQRTQTASSVVPVKIIVRTAFFHDDTHPRKQSQPCCCNHI